MSRYKAVIFDFDYTLGDCTDTIVRGFQQAMAELGLPIPDREAIRATVGYRLEEAYTVLTGDADPEHQNAFRPVYSKFARKNQVEEAKLFPGADTLLLGLDRRGVKLAIVSSRRSASIRAMMERFGLSQCLQAVLGDESVKAPKPDPQGLRMAMEQLGVQSGETLFCGDTVLDAGAARNAGCDFAAVLLGTTKAEAFAPFSPVHISPDLADLADWLRQ